MRGWTSFSTKSAKPERGKTMKHKFSLEILLVTGFSFLFAPNLSVNAQTHSLKRSGFTWDLGFGSGSYTGLGPRESGGITAYTPGTNSFSKLAFAFRVLLGTNLLDSRLGVGFEYSGQQIGEGAESEYVYTEGPDPMIHLMLITGEYSVIKFSTKINIIAGGGLGMLFFANTATRREYDANTMLWKESEKSTA